LLGKAGGFHKGRQGGFDLGCRQDEYFGDCDGVKPALDPAPYSREERGSTDNLVRYKLVNFTDYKEWKWDNIQRSDPLSLDNAPLQTHPSPANAP
jgi:hypothetical protein